MADIKVPELAESITEGTIAQWVKKVGDRVEKGEFIVELETDKVNAEIISEEAGVLTQILAEEGDTVLVGQEGRFHQCGLQGRQGYDDKQRHGPDGLRNRFRQEQDPECRETGYGLPSPE